jgi:hypothetical protein
MKSKRITFSLSLIVLILMTGCSSFRRSSKSAIWPSLAEQSVPPKDEVIVQRFQQAAPQNPTAIETAIELSEKYAKLSEDAAISRQKNQHLFTENQKLNDENTTLKTQLQQTKKELTEANNLLIDLRIELNNWKTDILGFREELRQADIEQLQALIKILEILGGELKTKSEENIKTSKIKTRTTENTNSTIQC